MEEHVFFEQRDVKVTNARFIVHGQTYAMNGVTSVKQLVQEPKRVGPIVLGIVGILTLLGGKLLWAIVLIGLAAFWWTKQKSEWLVMLNSASGEMRALSSRDREFIRSVIGALNDAIVHRG